MYRTTMRSASRPVIASLRSNTIRATPRRFNSTTTPADKSRSWKSSVARLGLAFGAVYYYNTSPIFADEAVSKTVPAPAAFSDDDLPTVDSVLEEKRKQIKAKSEKPAESSKPTESQQSNTQAAAADGSPSVLEEEADQQGAFNPETGEINWDCPCLGGMAHGPCGEEFKTAFSCFVYSTEEPKGMDCIEKFQGMQECFKKYPEIYGAELADDEEGAPTPDFGDEQPAPDARKAPATDKAPAADSKSLPENSSAAAELDEQAPRTTSSEAEKETLVNGSRKVQDVATPIEKPHNPELWQDMHKTKVPVKEVFVEPSQAHDATAANAEIKIIEQEREAKKKAETKQ
ncbi:mitochondrial intermembrane space import and assembly 40 [Fusarium subglutinans]|uniref:Mitochondrial intermembrane space import and assembly protein 40 n=1 Tax=Gibberella subglutinans TaxID=42677 RepID=A0A8H5QDF6_GIBSU|nr:mitochondrial intermembrane space import and assembly 40 [Fusarium subglutinans]KAF5614410.1 mitochondrial intermembrane space import and assembly 40 [Fusarium subglutinans]